MVDVNVHPTKMEVRFQKGVRFYSHLLQTLRHQFLTTDLTARVRMSGPNSTFAAHAASSPGAAGAHVVVNPANRNDDRWNDYGRMTRLGPTTSPQPVSGPPRLELADFKPNIADFCPFPETRSPLGVAISNFVRPSGSSDSSAASEALTSDSEAWNGNGAPGFSVRTIEHQDPSMVPSLGQDSNPQTESGQHLPNGSHLGFQVHNRYLVTQDEHGMVLIDQHALHERILYEQLRMKTESRTLESQQLLVPEPLDLTPAEAAAALDSRDLLAQIGIQVEPFGGDTVLMTSYPAMLANMRPAELLRQVLEPLMSGGKEPSARELLDELLHMIACKAAIKAGDKLSAEEITALLEQRYHYQDTHHCPHGRPTALYFSREQLDKMFKRT